MDTSKIELLRVQAEEELRSGRLRGFHPSTVMCLIWHIDTLEKKLKEKKGNSHDSVAS